MRQVFPRGPVRAIVLADSTPRALTEIWAPSLPVLLARPGLQKPRIFFCGAGIRHHLRIVLSIQRIDRVFPTVGHFSVPLSTTIVEWKCCRASFPRLSAFALQTDIESVHRISPSDLT